MTVKTFFTVIWDKLAEIFVTDGEINWKNKFCIQLTRIIWILFIAIAFCLMILNLLPILKDYINEATVTSVTTRSLRSSRFTRMNRCYFMQYDISTATLFNTSIHKYSAINHYLATSSEGFLYFALQPELWKSTNMVGKANTMATSINVTSKQLLDSAKLEISQMKTRFLEYYSYKTLKCNGLIVTSLIKNSFSQFQTFLDQKQLPLDILIKRTNNSLKVRAIDLAFKICFMVPIAGDLRMGRMNTYTKRRNIYELVEFFSLGAPIIHTAVDFPFSLNVLDGTTKNDVTVTTILTAKPTQFILANLKRRPCVQAPSFRQIVESGPNRCFDSCMSYALERRFNCRFTNKNQFRTSAEEKQGLCNIYPILQSILDANDELPLLSIKELISLPYGYGLNRKNLASLDRRNKTTQLSNLRKVYTTLYRQGQKTDSECTKKCESFRFCTEWSVDISEKSATDESDPTGRHANRSTVHLKRKIGVSLSSTLVIIDESLKEPITSFFANLGGVIGLYFGFSIMTILGLGSYYLNMCMISARRQTSARTSDMIMNQLAKKAVIEQLRQGLSVISTDDVVQSNGKY